MRTYTHRPPTLLRRLTVLLGLLAVLAGSLAIVVVLDAEARCARDAWEGL